MSTKTSIKRVALVGVSALGFGLLSVVPAKAAIATIATGTITQTNSVVRASTTAATTVNFTLTGATAGDNISAIVTGVPTGATGNTVEVGDVFAGTAASATAGSVVIGADKTAVVAASCANASTGAAATTASRSALGVVTITTAAAHGFTAGQVITTSAALVWDLIDDNANDASETLLGSGAQITILGVPSATSFTYLSGNSEDLDTEDTTLTANLFRAVNTVYTASSGGAVQSPQLVNAGDTRVDTGSLICNGLTRPSSATVTNDWMNVAGTYTFTAWYDANNDGVKDSGENIATSFSVTVGGTPTAITVTPQTAIGSEATDYAAWVYLRDAAGNATKLVAGEELSVRIDNNPGSPMDTLAIDDDASSAGGVAGATNLVSTPSLQGTTTYHLYTFSAAHTAAFTNGSVKISANFGGTLTPLATAASASVAILDTGAATSIEVKSGTKGVSEDADTLYAFPEAVGEAESNEIYANPLQALSITYVITGAPNTYVDVTVDNDGGTAPTGVLATGITTRTEAVLLDASGQKEYTVTATAAAVGNKYAISSKNGAEFVVVYNAAGVNSATNSVAELPSGVSKVLTPVAGSSAFNVTVADDYDNRYQGYVVRLTTSSTSRNASKVVQTTSGANGVASLSLADAGTTGTDTATISIFAPDNTVTAVQTWTVTITYAANVSGSLSVGGGTVGSSVFYAPVAAYDRDLDTASGTLASAIASEDNACVAISHVLRDANLAPITGYAAKFTGVTSGIRFLTSVNNDDCGTGNDYWDSAASTVFTHANNQTIVYALASKTGVNEIKIESGGYTQTVKFTAITLPEFARHLTVTSPAAPVAQTVGALFTANVTDGFGNVVEGVNVNYQITGGRSLTGASASVVPTDANGNAVISVTSDTNGSIGVKASFTGGQSTYVAADPVAEFKAASPSGTGTGTVSGDSPSVAASKAAEAAAKAAGDAAVAAAKAAQDAAVAAAKASEEAAKKAAADAVAAAKAAEAAAVAKAEEATDASLEAIDAANAATDAANLAAEAADAATVAAEEARDAADAATAAVEALASEISTLISGLRAQITTLANTVAKIAKKVRA